MRKHKQTGILGEQKAAELLEKLGYNILCRNCRFGHKEVDIIAAQNGIAILVEIKTRTGYDFGFPEDAVTPAKQQHLRAAATAFLEANPEYTEVRYDVVSIVLNRAGVADLRHLPDAFF